MDNPIISHRENDALNTKGMKGRPQKDKKTERAPAAKPKANNYQVIDLISDGEEDKDEDEDSLAEAQSHFVAISSAEDLSCEGDENSSINFSCARSRGLSGYRLETSIADTAVKSNDDVHNNTESKIIQDKISAKFGMPIGSTEDTLSQYSQDQDSVLKGVMLGTEVFFRGQCFPGGTGRQDKSSCEVKSDGILLKLVADKGNTIVPNGIIPIKSILEPLTEKTIFFKDFFLKHVWYALIFYFTLPSQIC